MIVGAMYEAWGPTGKYGPPQCVRVVEELEHGWRTEGGKRPVANIIRHECAHMWNLVEE